MKPKDRPARWWNYAWTLFVFVVLCAILWFAQHPQAVPFIAQTAPDSVKP